MKGLVTIATVKAPASFASFATTGDAPVPVPPPMPAVINTISDPCNASVISFWSALAHSFPNSGLPPTPKPFAIFFPI